MELRTLLQSLRSISGHDEVIVADASTSASCAAIAAEFAARVILCAAPNRGAQMNAGGEAARGAVLLFQHADTCLTQAHVDALREAMADVHVGGGAFHRKFDARHPFFHFLEPLARLLSARATGTLYGDQSIFVRRTVFHELGGFAPIPLMEDMEFSRRLRRSARTVVLDPPIASSPRRHQREGALKSSVQNALFIALFNLGVSPHALHHWYYRRRRMLNASG